MLSGNNDAFLVTSSWLYLPIINFGLWLSLHLENANEAAFHTGQGMIYQDVIPTKLQRSGVCLQA